MLLSSIHSTFVLRVYYVFHSIEVSGFLPISLVPNFFNLSGIIVIQLQ